MPLMRCFLRFLACLPALLVPGCASAPRASSLASPVQNKKKAFSTPTDGRPIRAAVVLGSGGVDDRSFNAAAWRGMQQAQKDLSLAENGIKYVESKDSSDYKPNLTAFAGQSYDLIFGVGYQLAGAVKEVAPQFPNVKFALVDSPSPGTPNCVGLVFKEQEGSFLAGFLAASMSKTRKIGFVGGEQIPIVERFEAGYKAGAKTADPKVVVSATYTGDWNDQGKGRSQAEQQFGAGADVILEGAGKSGLGVIEAAREKGAGFYAIGSDQDQDDLAPGRVLTTVIKHTDFAVSDTMRRVKEGQFKGGTQVYGLKEGGMGLSNMRHTRQAISPEIMAKLAEIKQEISDGKLIVPTTLKELENFQPPKL